MATLSDLLASKRQLEGISDSPALDVELLLCHALKKNRSFLRAWPEHRPDSEQEKYFHNLLVRRIAGEPIAYLLGEQEFWTLTLEVSPATLIPRPETELLVEKTLSLLSAEKHQLLDLGTGTGAVALAVASERPSWQLTACDIEASAIELAKRNRSRCQLGNVELLKSDWFEALANHRFDAIVSNPPYIDSSDPHLQQGDVRFEPRSALVANNNGLADIEKIVQLAPNYLSANGWLLFEHGYQQGEAARDLLRARGFSDIFTDKDLASLDRISGGCWRPRN